MKASIIIQNKLNEAGGKALITLLNGDNCYLTRESADSFTCDKLPHQYVTFNIFDIVVDFLKNQKYGKAVKGGCRNSKVGEGKCGKETIMYIIATKYYKKEIGDSSFDPLFVIAAVLDWAGIARNSRGFITLNNPTIW